MEPNASDAALSRRSFLGSAAAAGASALLPGEASAQRKRKSGAAHDAPGKVAVRPVAPKGLLKAQPFALTDVRLLPGFWRDTMERNRAFLYSLPNDRLAHNFRVTASLTSDAEPLGGWEAPDCELRGHYVGHYLSACALLHASTGDQPIADKANALVAILAQCQFPDGYLGAYPAAFYQRLRDHQPVWAPFYTYHKILAGLIDMYVLCGNQQALTVACRMADWADGYAQSISNDGPDSPWQRVLLVEQGGMNEALFNLYALTGRAKYHDLAYRFEHKRIFDPLADNQDKLSGNHANTNIPKVIGAIRGWEITGDERYAGIAANFYRMVTQHHAYCTGGTSNYESWHAPDAIAGQLGPDAEECCCSYNMLKLSRHLYTRQPDPRFFDYYERVLYNVRYGTQDRNGMLMYYVSLKPGLYKTFGTALNTFWCCTGTGSEEYAKLNNSIYFHNDDSLYINLFIPSRLDWKERGLQLRQTTKFPHEQRIAFTIDRPPLRPTALKLRIPYWATGAVAVRINGAPQTVSARPSTYLTLADPARAWKPGDVIEVDMSLTLHLDTAPDDPQVQAAMYGPLVLAARLGADGLPASATYGPKGPAGYDEGYPMPSVDPRADAGPAAPSGGEAQTQTPSGTDAVWFEQVEGTSQYTLQFRTRGRGVLHTLAPLNQIMDERYSVYLRNRSIV